MTRHRHHDRHRDTCPRLYDVPALLPPPTRPCPRCRGVVGTGAPTPGPCPDCGGSGRLPEPEGIRH